MLQRIESGRGFNPFKDKQAGQALTHEDLVRIVGLDYQEILDNKAVWLGLIAQGESLSPNHPPQHIGSDAEYIYEGVIKDHWVFVYVLRNRLGGDGEKKKGRTTGHRHNHPEVLSFVEDYHLLRGQMSLFLGEEKREMVLNEEKNHFRIPPNTFHVAESSDSFAFILVDLPQTSHVPRSELHVLS